MSWTVVGMMVMAWWIYRLIAHCTQAPDANDPDLARAQAIALALPSGSRWVTHFEATDGIEDPEVLEAQLRVPLLHAFGVRQEASPSQIRAMLPALLRTRWFRMDLDRLRMDDDPRDALAFACARVAFATRVAGLVGWIDEETQWAVLLDNARRAGECFNSWQDYGEAWARGRRQWVAASRADSLGLAFDATAVTQWLSQPKHPWAQLRWPAARSIDHS